MQLTESIKNIVIVIVLLALLALLVFGGILLYRYANGITTPLIPNATIPRPMIDPTKLSQITITPGPDQKQMEQIRATVEPTRWTEWQDGDPQKFREGITNLVVTNKNLNWTMVSQIGHPGVGWYCQDYTLAGIHMPDSNFGAMAATWAEWQIGIDNKTISVDVKSGTDITLPQPGESHDISRPMANVTIHIKDWGVNGPIIRAGNTLMRTFQTPSTFWEFLSTSKRMIWSTDIDPQKQDLSNEGALQIAQWDSIVPLKADGTRDDKYLMELFAMLKYNLTTTSGDVGNPSVNDTFTLWALDTAKASGYYVDDVAYQACLAKLGSEKNACLLDLAHRSLTLKIVIDQEPRGIYDFYYLERSAEGKLVNLIPTNLGGIFIGSTCSDVPEQELLDAARLDAASQKK